MKNTVLPGIKVVNKQQNYSLHQLSKWNQQIDMQRLRTVHEQQDIKKQKKITKQNTTTLNDSILHVQQQAINISKQIQQQRTKFQHLAILVKNAEQQIYSQKLQRYEDVMNKKETDEYEQQVKMLKEKERMLEKVFERLNASEFEISKKIDAIRSLKKDRGFHSNLFDKLEREYFDVVFYYKQQLIQRKLRERILENATAEFNNVLQRSQEESPQFDVYGTNYGKGLMSFDNRQGKKRKQQPRVSKIPELRFARPSQAKNTEVLKTKKPLQKSMRTTQDLRKFEFKKKVNQILNDFGCKSYQQFALADINFQSQSHEQVLTQANNHFEQIAKLQGSIRELQALIREKRDNCQNQQGGKKRNAERSIDRYEAEISMQKEQVGRFKLQLYELIGETVGKDTEGGETQRVLEGVRSSKDGGLNFSEDMQVLKQAMTYINDNILKGPFPHFPSAKKSSNKTQTTQLSPQRARTKKLTIINISKDEQIEVPSTSNRRSQGGLDQILRTFQSDNQRLKSKKGEKQDSMSILTQSEFILESKKIITQVNKKSIFARGPQLANNNSKK